MNKQTEIKNPHNLNLPLFLKVVRVIKAEPKRVSMREWVLTKHSAPDYGTYAASLPLPDCGTVACIAGWASILSNELVQHQPELNPEGIPVEALADLIENQISVGGFSGGRALGVGYNTTDAHQLFYVDKWDDEKAKSLYEKADADNDPEGRARAVIMRIESFLKSKGVSLKQFYAQEV